MILLASSDLLSMWLSANFLPQLYKASGALVSVPIPDIDRQDDDNKDDTYGGAADDDNDIDNDDLENNGKKR